MNRSQTSFNLKIWNHNFGFIFCSSKFGSLAAACSSAGGFSRLVLMMILIPAATGATSFDINRVSTFIETRSMRSRSSSSGKL